MKVEQSGLGAATAYPDRYAPELLFPIPRRETRSGLDLHGPVPFEGVDIWNAYELSWIEPCGRPAVACVEIRVPADSTALIESKSLKLYLGSFHAEVIGRGELLRRLRADLSAAAEATTEVRIIDRDAAWPTGNCVGESLDDQPVQAIADEPAAALLRPVAASAQSWHTHLFRSVCPVTAQPDWAAVEVRLKGRGVAPESLLGYLLAYRRHAGFHEQCVERIYLDLLRTVAPDGLTVYARFTRRGGIDINPFRSNFEAAPVNRTVWRQ